MKRIVHYLGVGILLFTLFTPAIADVIMPPLDNERESSFREYIHLPASAVAIRVPTVVEMPLDGKIIEYPFFVVRDITGTGEKYIGNYFRRSVAVSRAVISLLKPQESSWASMLDGNYQTHANFAVPEDGSGKVTIQLTGAKPVTASSLTVLLDNQVALPNTILVQADTKNGGTNTVVLNTIKMSGNTVRFPKTTSSHWKVTFTYSQPLRITELLVNDEEALRATSQGLRFLAVPGHDYVVYLNADRPVTDLSTTESGDLFTDKGVVRIASVAATDNPAYVIADTDQDGVPDVTDNCVSLFNPLQEDVDGNGRGDTCEDFDRDGMLNAKDNCPNDPNVAQADTDGDGMGDSCDSEESRITEKNAWLPWAGMGIALIVLVGLMFLMMRSGGSSKSSDPTKPAP